MVSDPNKYIFTLEFNKILKLLQNEASCLETKTIISNINPVDNYDYIIKEMIKTNDAYKLIMSFGMPQIDFDNDLKIIIDKAKLSAQLTISELLVVSNFLSVIYNLVKWKKNSENLKTNLDYLFNNLTLIKDLKSKIDTTIISEDKIADNASENLSMIRRKLHRSSYKIREILENLIKSPVYQKYLQEPIITIRDGRFVIPLKSEHKNEIKGLVHDTSASGATLFVEPITVIQANNEIKILEKQELEEINKILNLLSSQVSLNLQNLIKNYNSLLVLDLYFAKAKLGCQMKAVIPKINNLGKINLINARHPLISDDKVVPININLGNEFDSLIITGPNTGGKTVVLKTVGLLTTMAMCGLMIPADENSEVSIFENILVDIGDEQNIEQSLSTFSAHMVNIISILKSANKNSLVLIDELGAGTDPMEGAGLAISILEELKSKGSKVVVTTHYSEIKLYALGTDNVENASCEFDIKTLKPTYKLSIGVPGKSNALLISKKLGLDDDIINRAKLLMGNEKNKFEDVIFSLETTKLELENKKLEINELERKIKQDKQKISEIRSEIEKNRVKELDKAKKEAKKIINQVKSESKLILDELDELLKQKNNENFYKMITDVKSQISSKFKNLDDISDPIEENINFIDALDQNQSIIPGDKVKVLDLNQNATVISNIDKDGFYFVQIGPFKKKLHFSNLIKLKSQKINQNSFITKNFNKKSQEKINSEINLRGLDVVTALNELDKFIDDALILGLKSIRIIHGKGTGTLRAAVSDFLKSSKNIDNFRLGRFGEGEDGVTIVSLK